MKESKLQKRVIKINILLLGFTNNIAQILWIETSKLKGERYTKDWKAGTDYLDYVTSNGRQHRENSVMYTKVQSKKTISSQCGICIRSSTMAGKKEDSAA